MKADAALAPLSALHMLFHAEALLPPQVPPQEFYRDWVLVCLRRRRRERGLTPAEEVVYRKVRAREWRLSAIEDGMRPVVSMTLEFAPVVKSIDLTHMVTA